jgi:hypothetical protein
MKRMIARIVSIVALVAALPACGGNGGEGDAGDDEGLPDADVDVDQDVDAADDSAEGEDCEPQTCSDLGKECGTWPDGCGDTVTCGPCGPGWGCSEEGICVALPPAGGPVLFFSDLQSGPKTGWEDGAAHGAAVSIWGRNFGPDRGSSFVTVGGVDLTDDADYSLWGGHGPARGADGPDPPGAREACW